MKPLADEALQELSALFDAMYAWVGRPWMPPEHLLKASLLMALFSVRSERMFCEQLGYNMLFRWFLDMEMVDTAFDRRCSATIGSACSSAMSPVGSSRRWSRARGSAVR